MTFRLRMLSTRHFGFRVVLISLSAKTTCIRGDHVARLRSTTLSIAKIAVHEDQLGSSDFALTALPSYPRTNYSSFLGCWHQLLKRNFFVVLCLNGMLEKP